MSAPTSFLDLLEPLQPPSFPRRRDIGDEGTDDARAARALADAEARADALVACAEQEAQTLLEDARIQAEALREAAWQEGFHDGQTTGRSAIEMTLRDEWEAEKQALRAWLAEMVAAIGNARQALWERQESEMTAFVLAIARQVVKTEVAQNPEVIRAIIQNAMRRVTDKQYVRLRVSAGDAPGVKAMRDEIIAMTDGLREIEIIDDRRIGDGGCVIETGAGTIDARIETQLAEVERAVEAYAGPVTESHAAGQ